MFKKIFVCLLFKKIKIYGVINIYVHALVLLLVILAYSSYLEVTKSPIDTSMNSFVFLIGYSFCLIVHEFGHALLAKLLKKEIVEIVFGALHGECRYINNGENEKHLIFIAWGGVIAQFILALISYLYLLFGVLGYHDFGIAFVSEFAVVTLVLSIVGVCVNLIPIFPLDGYFAWKILKIKKSRNKLRVVK